MEKISESGSGMNIPVNMSESLEILKFFDADLGSFWTLDQGSGMENSDPGSGVNIPDPQH
jgi:hypothetical protein